MQEAQCREFIRKQFSHNFGRFDDLHEAMQVYRSHENLYRGISEQINTLPSGIDDLQALNMNACIYIDKTITDAIEKYIELTRFSYMTDDIGLINDYVDAFFTNLLDADNEKEIIAQYTTAMNNLRRLG